MVKLLAELHHGTVAVESALGEGSCFTVWLPLRSEEEPLPGAHLPIPALMTAPTDPGLTALVVEDDAKSAELIRTQLEAEGFTVLHAVSAEAALLLAAKQPLSLITLDIMLPNMDGWEFLTRFKQMPTLQRVPVVIISIASDENRRFALGTGALAALALPYLFLQKPISRQQLYESLVELGLFPLAEGQTLKVLVVDDDPKAVEVIATRILALAGTVIRAYGGGEAIELARRERPDVIVLDLMMPEVSGFSVVQALNEHPETARIPILVVTAKQITAEDRATLSGCVTTIIEKAEFDPVRFSAEVRRAISGHAVEV
jgi:CheY-like chemotaxis protein